jgi:hypothetical protein
MYVQICAKTISNNQSQRAALPNWYVLTDIDQATSNLNSIVLYTDRKREQRQNSDMIHSLRVHRKFIILIYIGNIVP